MPQYDRIKASCESGRRESTRCKWLGWHQAIIGTVHHAIVTLAHLWRRDDTGPAVEDWRAVRRNERRRRYRSGLGAELIAAARLMASGYLIVDWRYRDRCGEIDLVAVRGQRLAFVEVKCRRDTASAIDAITPRQRRRVIKAAAVWQKRHRDFRCHQPAFDAVLVVPGRWPQHWRDAFPFRFA